MTVYLPRSLESEIIRLSENFPVVVLTGPHQVGKTSIVKHLIKQFPGKAVYLDLEFPADLNKLINPALFLESLQRNTVS